MGLKWDSVFANANKQTIGFEMKWFRIKTNSIWMINYQHAEEGQVVPFVHSSLFHTHTARGTMQERRKLETETVVVYIFPFSAINAGNILQLVCTKSIANYTLLVAGNAMPAITFLSYLHFYHASLFKNFISYSTLSQTP